MSAIQHPGWCVGEAGGCVGRRHQSADLVVPGNEISGLQATVGLWRGRDGRHFVQLTLTPVRHNFAGFLIACALGERIREAGRTGLEIGATPPSSVVVDEFADIDDSRLGIHDFTLDQAEALHLALGTLLATAKSDASAPQEGSAR